MRKVHLISVTEPLLFDLALAIHQKGYEVSVSGVGLTDTTLARLEKEERRADVHLCGYRIRQGN